MKRALVAAIVIVCIAASASCALSQGVAADATWPPAQDQEASGAAATDTQVSSAGPSLSPTAAASEQASPKGPQGSVSFTDIDVTVLPAQSKTPSSKPAITTAKASPKPAMAAAPDVSAAISAEAAKFADKSGKYYDAARFSSNHYKYTQEELKMLAIVIRTEVGGESYRAKLAVANVVMNRVLARGYPGATIKEVILRPNQFCYYASVKPTAECYRAAHDVLDHEVWVVPQNTYFFRSSGSKANWGSHEYWGHIGSTAFYQDTYVGRQNGDKIPQGLYERAYKWPQYGCKPAARVRKVQKMLSALGYTVTADGYFGTGTKNALIKFQSDSHLTADGIAGPATLRALIAKYGLSKYLKL